MSIKKSLFHRGSNQSTAGMGWSNAGSSQAHVCGCIGCCRECGSCVTAPWHTADYCALLQRQAKEREEFLYQTGKD